MRNRRLFIGGVLAVVSVGYSGGPVFGQYTGWQQTLFRGLEFVGDRTFSLFPDGGPLFENNIYDHAIRYNRTGRGYTYEQFRFFGTDTFDNPNTLDLGPIKLQLGVDPTLVNTNQPVGIHDQIGYTTVLIPELFFQSETGQRGFDVFSGQTSFRPAPIRYNVTVNTGVQDFEWTGNIIYSADGRINALGFYDFSMQITNVGQYTADGFVVHDEQVTDFDTGPVELSGHVLFDAFASLAQMLGQTEAAAFPRSISGATGSIDSNKMKVDEILTRLSSGEAVTDAEMDFLMQQMFITAFQNDPLGFIQNGMPTSVPGFEALNLEISEEQPAIEDLTTIPEPGTMLLVGSALAAITCARKQRAKTRD
ncbi:MAG: hypothetical protein DCC65_02565 [Planctomycetota bacterium]|nr:MAG: hypothetical protein DCC65_02565 [Planctomycetota bacterium]